MLKINVQKGGEEPGKWIFNIDLAFEGEKYEYEVFLEKEYYKVLTGESVPAVTLVQDSFFFLLDREPPRAILKEFNLKEINTYFNDYEETMRSRYEM